MSSDPEDKNFLNNEIINPEINNNSSENKVKKSIMNSTAKEFIPKNKIKEFNTNFSTHESKSLSMSKETMSVVTDLIEESEPSSDKPVEDSKLGENDSTGNIYSPKSIESSSTITRPRSLGMNTSPNSTAVDMNTFQNVYSTMPLPANQPIYPMDYACMTNTAGTVDQSYLSSMTTTSPVIVQQANVPTVNPHNQLNLYQTFHNSGGSSPHSYQSVSPPILNNNYPTMSSTTNPHVNSTNITSLTGGGGGTGGEHYVMVHVNLGETFSIRVGEQIQNISGPATVRMVSNSGPPTPMPMQVPPGHMVQQIVDENGILTHVILSPLHQPAPPQHSHSSNAVTGPCIGPHHLHSTSNPSQGSFYNSSHNAVQTNLPAYSNNYLYHNGGNNMPLPTTINNVNNSSQAVSSVSNSNVGNTDYYRSSQSQTESSKPRPNTAKNRNTVGISHQTHYQSNSDEINYKSKISSNNKDNNTTIISNDTKDSPVTTGTTNAVSNIAATTTTVSTSSTGSHHQQQHHHIHHSHPHQHQHHFNTNQHHNNNSKQSNIIISNDNSTNSTNSRSDYSYYENFPSYNAHTHYKHRKRRPPFASKYNYSASANTKHPYIQDHSGSPISSADEVGTILTDEEKNAIRDVLNTIEKPEVSEIEARSALIYIKCPKVPDNCVATINSADFTFQLHFAERNPESRFNCVFYGDAVEISLQDLKPATDYYVKVCCIYENITSNLSSYNKFTTKPSEPNPPKPVIMQSKTRNSIQVKWTSPVENGSKTSDFIVEYSRADSNTDTFTQAYRGNNKTFKIQKLKPSTEYLIRLAAVNSYGQSGWSETTSITTSGTAPTPPEAPSLARADTSGLLLTWNKRISDETFCLEMMDEATGYGFITIFNGSEVEHYVENLRRNTDYRFRLAASNLDGRSKWSETVTLSTKPALPGPPLKLHTRGRIHPTQCVLVWDPPEDDGGLQIDCYRLELDTSSSDTVDRDWIMVFEGETREYSCTKLTPGSQIYARVSARSSTNGTGSWGPFCDPVTITLAACAPGPMAPPRKDIGVTSLTTSTGGSGRNRSSSSSGGVFVPGGINLIWEKPENDGGSTITGYELCQWFLKTKSRVSQSTEEPVIEEVLEESDEQIVYKGDQLTCQINGLIPGSQYRYRIRAINKAGYGRWSPFMDATSGPSAPEPPSTPPTVVCKSPHGVSVSWDAPIQSNGSPIIEYKVEIKIKSDSNGATVAPVNNEFCLAYSGGAHTQCDLKNLQPNTTYLIRILAANRAGYSEPSPISEITTPASVPGLVTSLRFGQVTMHSIPLSWKEPQCCGGSPVTGYLIEALPQLSSSIIGIESNTSLSLQSIQCENTEKVVADLLPDTCYKFRVQAQNSVGLGQFCNAVKATTLSPPPAPPRLECVTVQSNLIKLRWHNDVSPRQYYISKMKSPVNNASTVGSGINDVNILQYQLQMSRQPESGWSNIYTGIAQFHKHSKLLESTTYYFRIMASNEMGDGEFSEPFKVTTEKAAPPAVRVPKVTEITSDSSVVEWPALRSMSNDPIVYILQLLTISEKDSDYRPLWKNAIQVYRGSDISHRLTNLTPGTEYLTRVCAVRLCSPSTIGQESSSQQDNENFVNTTTTASSDINTDISLSSVTLNRSNKANMKSKGNSSPVTELLGPFSKSIPFTTHQYGVSGSSSTGNNSSNSGYLSQKLSLLYGNTNASGSSSSYTGTNNDNLIFGNNSGGFVAATTTINNYTDNRVSLANLLSRRIIRPLRERLPPWTDKHYIILILVLFTLSVFGLANLLQRYLK